GWSSHKALKKLAGPHVPASLSKLEQAVKRAHAAYDTQGRDPGPRAAARRPPDGGAGEDDGIGDEFDEVA
ncbi:MAG TPA: hypothetical protein VFY45_10800, partial [Baekduia sp.]|nr:hypothetical protein [Baekduia sp.]